MGTKIHTTKKLERLIKKLIKTEDTGEEKDNPKLGKWNATVFYVNKKKCWMLTNRLTKYNVVLTDLKAADLKNIESIFKKSFHRQLTYDGIVTNYAQVDSIIGQLDFLPTDNDRKTTGFQNHRLRDLEWWAHEFEGLENMPIRDLTNRMNDAPIHIGRSYKISDYTDSIAEMKKLMVK